MADRVYTSPAYDLPFSWALRENATALGHGRGTRPEQFKLCLFLGIPRKSNQGKELEKRDAWYFYGLKPEARHQSIWFIETARWSIQ